MKWSVLNSNYVFQNKWLAIRKDHVRLPSNYEIQDFYIIEQSSFVNIVAIDKNDRFILEEQYRHGLQQVNYELPAGKIDDDETPLQAAQRELLEETGFCGGEWFPFSISAPNTSNMDSICYTFLAIGVEQKFERCLEASELINLHFVTKEELLQLLCKQKIMEGVHQAPLWKYLFENFNTPSYGLQNSLV